MSGFTPPFMVNPPSNRQCRLGGTKHGIAGGETSRLAIKQKSGFHSSGRKGHHFGRLSRIDLGLLIQFVTGHNYLCRHRKVMGEEDDRCRLCGEDIEDSLHLWENCKATRDLRGGFIKCTSTIWSLSQLSMFLREQIIAGLMDQNG